MSTGPFRIWCNMQFPAAATEQLREGTSRHELVLARNLTASNLSPAEADPAILEADIILGQPDPASLPQTTRLRWAHLTSAGYERYDKPDLRVALTQKQIALTSSSAVYADPCAEHALAMLMSMARGLPRALSNQANERAWPAAAIRIDSHLLQGQTILMLGYGSIGRRLSELLAPFRINLFAIRRSPKGDPGVATYPESYIDRLLPAADHVINLLPGGTSTANFMSADRFGKMKPTAIYYNIGRGPTTDQEALINALRARQISGAYLDVMTPEPLPSDHPLWTAPNCYITPHTAGGHHNEFHRLVQHFLDNLTLFERGQALRDRVI
jgi:phosphoglycerate dehydrogenase-like enzyme